ncbi:MAG: YopX family protein [Clostridia bacterium]|jgi:uncharacterized phage protein (TIGR01671 family)
MNREIKFRAWDGEQMRYEFLVARPQSVDVLSILTNEDFAKKRYGLKEWKVMQFTGKRDKNKKEIYEHDIVIIDIDKENGRTVPVWIEYIDNMAQFRGYVLNTSECEDVDISELDDYELEIVGNIHENKDLLNEQKTT